MAADAAVAEQSGSPLASVSKSPWGKALRFHGAGAVQTQDGDMRDDDMRRMAALSTLSTEEIRHQLRQPYATSLEVYALAYRCHHAVALTSPYTWVGAGCS